MKKRIAVLLLRIEGEPDQPAKSYVDQLYTMAGKGTNNLIDYYEDMSHGNLDITDNTVFDWINYNHTVQDLMDEWNRAKDEQKRLLLRSGVPEAKAEDQANVHANRTRRGKITEWGNEAASANNISLAGYDVIVYIFNVSVDLFGSPGRAVISWNPGTNNHAANSIDLSCASHEVGHALGLSGHSRLENSIDEYGDQWDIMGNNHFLSDKSGTQIPPLTPYYTYGPGLNAAYMDLLGWLDKSRMFTASGSASFQLRPLHRRDLPGWLSARLQIGYETLFLEFRMNEKWDSSLPAPCVLLHRKSVHPGDGTPCTEILVTNSSAFDQTEMVDLRNGESFETGTLEDPFGFYAKITVSKIDVEQRTAFIQVYIREKRQIEPQGTPYGGVTVDGGGLVWTPGAPVAFIGYRRITG